VIDPLGVEEGDENSDASLDEADVSLNSKSIIHDK
jgi:hypothetical protein